VRAEVEQLEATAHRREGQQIDAHRQGQCEAGRGAGDLALRHRPMTDPGRAQLPRRAATGGQGGTQRRPGDQGRSSGSPALRANPTALVLRPQRPLPCSIQPVCAETRRPRGRRRAEAGQAATAPARRFFDSGAPPRFGPPRKRPRPAQALQELGRDGNGPAPAVLQQQGLPAMTQSSRREPSHLRGLGRTAPACSGLPISAGYCSPPWCGRCGVAALSRLREGQTSLHALRGPWSSACPCCVSSGLRQA